MERPQLTDEDLLQALEALTGAVGKRIQKHGRHATASNKESLGVLTVEWYELLGAIHSRDVQNIVEEFLDVAASGVIAVASMVAGARLTEGPAVVNTDESTSSSVEDAAERARQIMIDRARASNIEIATSV